jgi:3-oxoacyl-(acyl-carrier-protein) synthase
MINSLGHERESSFERIVAGETGVDRITLFDPSNQAVQIAAEVKGFDPKSVMDPREVKKADRFIQLGSDGGCWLEWSGGSGAFWDQLRQWDRGSAYH